MGVLLDTVRELKRQDCAVADTALLVAAQKEMTFNVVESDVIKFPK